LWINRSRGSFDSNRAVPVAWNSLAPCTGHSFGTYTSKTCSRHICSLIPTSLNNLTVSRVRAANIVRRPCSDSSHVTAPYKLSFYYYYYYYYYTMLQGLQDNSLTNQLAVSQVADWSTRGL